ncbi:hypothetical protein [Rhodanobacter glycinis]|uniref:Uncharacterized protein n=1 Tax=Rhodanobacter glycinis TaxID=582702 RepID=A0A1I3ZN56_9GAMM|nr:hypothetical protein [Rhodanobacter glycinis]SFK45111.1 hypothetical protein SAMN05192579_10312 [Rhodanobacter glycinis]
MTDLISTATTAIQLVTRLREINKNIANAEFNNALADLSIELANLKIQVAGLLEENDQLKRKLDQKDSSSVSFKGFAYFKSDGEGPFCPGCYDTAGKLIRLAKTSATFNVFGSHSCPSCKEHFSAA